MSEINSYKSIRRVLIVFTLVLLALPGLALASQHEGGAAAEITAMILADSEYVRANLKDSEGGVSQHGSVEFWSSGGLIQQVAPNSNIAEYESVSLTPKHIQVIELPGGESAVAMYYSEGSMTPKGGKTVDHYMTRVLQVYVKENGKWVVRAAHWSPIAAGAGTNQTSLD